MVFQFDTFDQTAGKVTFELNNIEAGRNLADLFDPFTFLDDTHEYAPNVIGANGRMRTSAGWKFPNDGVVIPLRLEDSAFDSNTGYYELRNYTQNADGDANSNPTLRMVSFEGLNGWNIRTTDIATNSIQWRRVAFDAGTSAPKADIQLNIAEAQRCPALPLSGEGEGGNGEGGNGEGGNGEGGNGEGGNGEGGNGEGGNGEGGNGEGGNGEGGNGEGGNGEG